MTIIRTSLIAAFGLLAAGWLAPASAGATVAANPGIALSEVGGLQLVTDRGSWVERRTRWKSDRDYGHDRRYDRYDDRRHYKKKKKRKHFKRGYRRGYDEGYYEGRRDSRYKRRHHHRRYRDYGFRGGIYFGDGYYSGPGFRFRY